jgi:phospholipid/cholesterol/gamma-HCH transport system substrate-binding protein
VETEAKYVTVGIFILVALALGTGFVLWYSNARDGRSYNAYEIYFTGSVSGLDQGGVVRYLGVEVGRVRRLTINRTDSTPRVKVIAEIDSEAPISPATRASLSMQGVTGLLFINLKEAPEADSHGELPMGEKYPVIQSVTSDLDALLASLPTLVSRATVLIDRVSTVFSDDNLKALNSTVSSLQASTQNLPQTAAKVSAMVDELRNTIKVITASADDLHQITSDAKPQVQQTLHDLDRVVAGLAQTSGRLDHLLANSEVQLGHFTEHGLFQLERLLRDSRSAAREFRELSKSLKDNPSQILFAPPPGGVEVPP